MKGKKRSFFHFIQNFLRFVRITLGSVKGPKGVTENVL
jgi:hypothetical protein